MFELIGLIFGGVSRLGQHWMDLKEKDSERDHEYRMFEFQVQLADKKYAAEADMRRMDAESEERKGDTDALIAALTDQREQSKAAGGWVASFSAFMRPFLTFWHVVIIYTAVKVAMFVGVFDGGLSWHDALIQIYTDADRALCFSMASFWFADRALRNRFVRG